MTSITSRLTPRTVGIGLALIAVANVLFWMWD